MVQLEMIDIKHGKPTDLEKVEIINKLMEQMQTVGFLALTNIHDGYHEEEHLNACKAFHALPDEVKKKLYPKHENSENKNVYRGYFPFKKGNVSYKEFYDMGVRQQDIDQEEKQYPLYEDTPFPPDPELKWILDCFLKVQNIFMEVSKLLIECLAVGLGKPVNFFDGWFDKGNMSTFRTIHYMKRPEESSQGLDEHSAKFTTPEHSDSGFLTMLTTFGYPGLQVKMPDGEYHEVDPVSNGIVINIGDMFSRCTNYQLKATYHRVRDIGVERYSSPFFVDPQYSSRIPKNSNFLVEGHQSVSEIDSNILFGDWIIKRLIISYVEWKDFDIPESRKAAIDRISNEEFVNETRNTPIN